MTLSIVQKCDIVTRELDELKDEMQHVKDEAERNYDNFRVIMNYITILYFAGVELPCQKWT